MPEIGPDTIRSARLSRRLRGYDREQTEEFLAKVADGYERLHAERENLSDEVADLRRERQEAEERSQAELDRLKESLDERERHLGDLEAELGRLEEERSKQAVELDRLRDELLTVRAVQDELESKLEEHRDHTSRFVIREKALVEQRAMLVSQLEDEAMEAASEHPALPGQSDRVAAMLSRLDRFVEALERESRQSADLTLKKARERAQEIVRTAEARSRQIEAGALPADSVDEVEEFEPASALARIRPAMAAPEPSDAVEGDVGEASWTSRSGFDETPQQSR